MVSGDGGPLRERLFVCLRGGQEEEFVLGEAGDGAVLLQAQEGIADVAPVAGRGDAERAEDAALAPVLLVPAGAPDVVVAVDVAAAGRAGVEQAVQAGLPDAVVGHHEDGLVRIGGEPALEPGALELVYRAAADVGVRVVRVLERVEDDQVRPGRA